MTTPKKFEDLTKDQQISLKTAGRKFVTKMFFNGVNFGGLIFMSNLILVLVNEIYFKSTGLLITVCVVVDIVLLNMMSSANKQAASSFKEQARKIIDAEK